VKEVREREGERERERDSLLLPRPIPSPVLSLHTDEYTDLVGSLLD
jgi:hypothetical protein